MSHHILSKCLIKTSHKNFSTKFLIMSHHVSSCLKMSHHGSHVSLLCPSLKHCLGFLTSLTMAHNRTSNPTNEQRHSKYRAFQICLTNVFQLNLEFGNTLHLPAFHQCRIQKLKRHEALYVHFTSCNSIIIQALQEKNLPLRLKLSQFVFHQLVNNEAEKIKCCLVCSQLMFIKFPLFTSIQDVSLYNSSVKKHFEQQLCTTNIQVP